MQLPPQLAQQFERDRYVIVRGLLDRGACERLRDGMFAQAAQGKLVPDADEDPQGKTSVGLNRQPALEELLLQLLPTMEQINGKPLYPTYSYGRIYRHGADLYKHVDRNACEVSISLCLGFDADSPWPLWIQGPNGVTAAALEPGDAVLYRGIECPHWRETFTGNWNAQVFLHYVEQDGPHAIERYDRRPYLNLPQNQSRYGEQDPKPGGKYLHFRLPSAPAANLSCRLAALEMGVAIATLSNRILALEDASAPGEPQLSDLFEIPIEWVRTSDVNLSNLGAARFMPRALQQSVIVHPPLTATAGADFLAFALGRNYVFRIPEKTSKVDVLRMEGEQSGRGGLDEFANMALWSSTLHLDEASRQKVQQVLAQLKPRQKWISLAEQAAARLGRFAAFHLPAADDAIHLAEEMLGRIRRLTPPDAKVLLLAASPAHPLVLWLRDRLPGAIVWQDVFEAAHHPPQHPAVVQLLGQLVAVHAAAFAGSLGSMETAMIHRWRAQQMNDATPRFQFLSGRIFAEGAYASEKDAAYVARLNADGEMLGEPAMNYSWTSFPGSPSSAWLREWPECAAAPQLVPA